MGYESRVFIVKRMEYTYNDKSWIYCDEFARFDLEKMGYETVDGQYFREVFTRPIDFDIFPYDFATREDMYGDHCRYAFVGEVVEWLSESEVARDWIKANMFFRCLKTIQSMPDGDSFIVVHYGY